VPASRIILAGFSQGGAVALAAGLRRAAPLGGLVALSTYLPMAQRLLGEATVPARTQPVFMAHGTQDPVVPFAAGQRSAQALRDLGLDVDWHAYPMPHSVCPEELADLQRWLEARLQG